MKIENLARERRDDATRVSADVVWEERDQPRTRVHFETVEPFADDLALDPHAFLLAAVVPAFRWGEARVAIEGAICPRLRDGLATAMQILGRWWDPTRRPVRIEPSQGFRPSDPRPVARTGLFLSGGFDSLTSLYCNRRDFPRDHPAAVRDSFFVYGFDIGPPHWGDQAAFYATARASLAGVAAETGIAVIPVRTNLRAIDPTGRTSWPDEWFGAATAAVAHAFTRRISRVLLAGSMEVTRLEPFGSHPMLDPCFSSAALEVIHDGAHLSRLEKIRLVAEWETAFKVVRVCWAGLEPGGPLEAGGPLNCGRCRKCIRAMMGLLAIGRLGQAESFPIREVHPETLATSQLDSPYLLGFYRELLGPLDEVGRADLSTVLRRKIDEFERLRAWRADTGFKGGLRRLDRRYLGGMLLRLARRLS